MACNSCGDSFPAPGISRSIMYLGMVVVPFSSFRNAKKLEQQGTAWYFFFAPFALRLRGHIGCGAQGEVFGQMSRHFQLPPIEVHHLERVWGSSSRAARRQRP